jgi:REP element-mobilizing transposase RayT
VAFAVGGVADHVHIATALPRTLTIADLVEKLKVTSSLWIKDVSPSHSQFHWQRGYGAFSVSPSQLPEVVRYVENQDEHHRTRTFQEEFREVLRKHNLPFDERYVWD